MREPHPCPTVPRVNVVLVHPEIPHNTGAIGRVCVGLGARLHVVRPIGFSLRDKYLRRCGLDYWEHLDLAVHDSWDAYLEAERPAAMALFSARGGRDLYECRFAPGVHLVFGSETRGLPDEVRERHRDCLVRIPMPGAHARSINLANAAAIAAYEAYRQLRAEPGGATRARGPTPRRTRAPSA